MTLFMALALVFSIFTGCGSDDSDSDRKSREEESDGYMECLDTIIGMMTGEELSQAQVRKLQPEEMFEEKGSFSDYYEQVQAQCKTNANAMISAFGKDYVATYKIIEDNILPEADWYEATKRLNDVPWYNAEDVNEIRDMVVEISVSGQISSQTFPATFRLMLLDGDWVVLSAEAPELDAFLN